MDILLKLIENQRIRVCDFKGQFTHIPPIFLVLTWEAIWWKWRCYPNHSNCALPRTDGSAQSVIPWWLPLWTPAMWFSLAVVCSLSFPTEVTTRLLQPLWITIAQKPSFTQTRTNKDQKQDMEWNSTNIIYKIDCNKCNQFYVRRTGQHLKTRIPEHHLAVKGHNQNSLVLSPIENEQH